MLKGTLIDFDRAVHHLATPLLQLTVWLHRGADVAPLVGVTKRGD
jgi:hypothetical protein